MAEAEVAIADVERARPLFQQVPGLPIRFVDGLGVIRSKAKVIAPRYSDRRGNDVPQIAGNDVNNDEVEIVFRVVNGSPAKPAAITSALTLRTGRGLHLNAQQTAIIFDDKVVVLGFSPGLADGETVFGGTGHEAQFSPFPSGFGELNRRSFFK